MAAEVSCVAVRAFVYSFLFALFHLMGSSSPLSKLYAFNRRANKQIAATAGPGNKLRLSYRNNCACFYAGILSIFNIFLTKGGKFGYLCECHELSDTYDVMAA
jgi:hypothetical protein